MAQNSKVEVIQFLLSTKFNFDKVVQCHEQVECVGLLGHTLISTLQGMHAVEYVVFNTAVGTPGGTFTNEIGAEYSKQTLESAPSHWVQPRGGDRWDQGYDVTARFLDYCNSLKDGFVAQLNSKMKTGYSNNFFNLLICLGRLWINFGEKIELWWGGGMFVVVVCGDVDGAQLVETMKNNIIEKMNLNSWIGMLRNWIWLIGLGT
ncbi:hypothetical protein IFM89_016774 [Coptis chinensis]|uniref:Uncharacterized protein n=1 Tax=Coptis chinensis TaxID=261450 RepID=A0A835H6K6_9MAGN|nr:hypothetical protein IFM89_016774 [Coptis chinensis]